MRTTEFFSMRTEQEGNLAQNFFTSLSSIGKPGWVKWGVAPGQQFLIWAIRSSHHKGDKSMTVSTKPIPEGFHSVTPSLVVRGAAQAIDFYKKALGAEKLVRMPCAEGTIMHPEFKIADSL